MATTSQNHNFILSQHQQNLLFAALNSNKMPPLDTGNSIDPVSMTTNSFTESPRQQAPGSGTLNSFDESPFIDYDYEFDPDGSFNYSMDNLSQGQMIGQLPGTSSDGEDENHDKRSHPDDEDDEEDGGGGKRREGEEKGSKKPGRKPLTSEPTTKRKAQNRAAQRAFRERKEKHLKDLETKVQDLEKASESANHENSMLRAQIEKMAVELKEYKKSLAFANTRSSLPASGSISTYPGAKAHTSPNDVNFHFEFPRFGKLRGPPVNGSKSGSPEAQLHRASSSGNTGSISPFDQTLQHAASLGSLNNNELFQSPQSFDQTTNGLSGDMSAFSGLFSPSMLETADKGFNFDSSPQPQVMEKPLRTSTDSSRGNNSTGHSTTHNSPAASSNTGSNAGLSSSCETSPEPSTQSPGTFKGNEGLLSTIGEENVTGSTIQGEATFCDKLAEACGTAQDPIPRIMSKSLNLGTTQTPSYDFNGIDFWAQQNGGQFDPQIFGDYREPQNQVLTGGYDDSFFSEAFGLPEFNSPLGFAPSPAPKTNLVQEIDAKLNEDDEVVPEDEKQMLTCNTMWEKIQACPAVQSGEVDMDTLCSELQQKAKCSGDGPVINEKDFLAVVSKVLKKRDTNVKAT